MNQYQSLLQKLNEVLERYTKQKEEKSVELANLERNHDQNKRSIQFVKEEIQIVKSHIDLLKNPKLVKEQIKKFKKEAKLNKLYFILLGIGVIASIIAVIFNPIGLSNALIYLGIVFIAIVVTEGFLSFLFHTPLRMLRKTTSIDQEEQKLVKRQEEKQALEKERERLNDQILAKKQELEQLESSILEVKKNIELVSNEFDKVMQEPMIQDFIDEEFLGSEMIRGLRLPKQESIN